MKNKQNRCKIWAFAAMAMMIFGSSQCRAEEEENEGLSASQTAVSIGLPLTGLVAAIGGVLTYKNWDKIKAKYQAWKNPPIPHLEQINKKTPLSKEAQNEFQLARDIGNYKPLGKTWAQLNAETMPENQQEKKRAVQPQLTKKEYWKQMPDLDQKIKTTNDMGLRGFRQGTELRQQKKALEGQNPNPLDVQKIFEIRQEAALKKRKALQPETPSQSRSSLPYQGSLPSGISTTDPEDSDQKKFIEGFHTDDEGNIKHPLYSVNISDLRDDYKVVTSKYQKNKAEILEKLKQNRTRQKQRAEKQITERQIAKREKERAKRQIKSNIIKLPPLPGVPDITPPRRSMSRQGSQRSRSPRSKKP